MYRLNSTILDTNILFNSLKEVYDYLLTEFNDVEAIKLSENKLGGWDVKYRIGSEWFTSNLLKVYKLQETENVS